MIPSRLGIEPYSYDGLIECWLNRFSDAAHSEFWRASPRGMMFLLRGYLEDGQDVEPGTNLDLTLPIWQVGECLLHTERLANALDESASVIFRVSWKGLSGRSLRAWASRKRHFIISYS